MSRAEEIRAEQEKASAANPIIIEGLRKKQEPVEIAHEISRQFDLDDRTAYRWVVLTEETFDRSRRRIATGGLVLLWVGFLWTIAGILLRVLDVPLVAAPLLLGLVVGIPLAAIGLTVAVASRRLAR